MDKSSKVKAVSELFELVLYYYDNRDQPVNENFDFFTKVENCCIKLDLDFEEFKKEFNLITTPSL
ncbi:hypothetical protein [Mesobacillus harenae]|uniref:hypothetical protein n=1 Tax=Mesobacillus harenae TaxID=2213203 RepID=UPI0015806A2F|nr:hypothetical protein [Mesobacillus harenae]